MESFVAYAAPVMPGALPDLPNLPTVRTKGTGERVLTATLAGGVGYGWPGGWSQDRREQARHFKFWSYVAVTCIMDECARYLPHVGYVKAKDHKGGWREKTFRERRFQKTMHHVRPHEEVEMAEDDHPLLRIFEKPNAWDTAGLPDLIKEWVMFQCLHGNGYWWIIPHLLTGMPEELFILPSHWVWARYNRNTPTGLEHYEIRPFIGPGQFVIPPEELIHTREKNPLHKIDGYSPQQAIDNWVDELESAHRARFWQFRNQTGLSGAIELPPDYHDPDDQELERIYAKIFSRLQGESNYGRPAVLGPGMKFVPLKITPAESDFFNTVEQLRDSILAAWKVPKEVAGVQPSGGDLSWYAPLQQFVRNNIAPRLSYLGHVLTHSLCKRYDPNLRIWWDDPTPDNPEQVNRDITTDVQSKAISPNEIRAIRGREPWPGGDDPMGTASDVPIPMSTGMDFSGEDWATLVGADAGEEQGPGGPELPGSSEDDNRPPPNKRPFGKRWRRKVEFHEEDHPRAADGTFGSGGGNGSNDDSANEEPEDLSSALSGMQLDRRDERMLDELSDVENIRKLSNVPKKIEVMNIDKISGLDIDPDDDEVEAIDDPGTVPPIIVGHDGELIDGHHRLAGAIKGGNKDIDVIVATEEDLRAVEEFGGLQGRGSWSEEIWIRWMHYRTTLPRRGGKRFKAEFHEEDHPRATNGEFTSGGNGKWSTRSDGERAALREIEEYADMDKNGFVDAQQVAYAVADSTDSNENDSWDTIQNLLNAGYLEEGEDEQGRTAVRIGPGPAGKYPQVAEAVLSQAEEYGTITPEHAEIAGTDALLDQKVESPRNIADAVIDHLVDQGKLEITQENGHDVYRLPESKLAKRCTDRRLQKRLQRRAEFHEEDHPRATDGRFGDKPGEHESSEGRKPVPSSVEAENDWKKNGTRSKAFKAWFGDWENDPENASKVIDAEGRPVKTHPIEVYHGSPRIDLTNFHHGISGGAFFTTDKGAAADFARRGGSEGKVYTVYLCAKNPLDLREHGQDVSGVYALRDDLIEKGMSEREANRLFDVDEDDPELSSLWVYVRKKSVSEAIQKHYDGLFFEDYGTPSNPDAEFTSYVVFQSSQVKSVDNRGTFDPHDPNIGKRFPLPQVYRGKQLFYPRVKDASAAQRAYDADLVTFGDDVPDGAVCANCEYIGEQDGTDYCENEKVDQPLPDGRDKMCCSFWDRPGTDRRLQHKGNGRRFSFRKGEFHEEDHPRNEDGEFTSGGGGRGGSNGAALPEIDRRGRKKPSEPPRHPGARHGSTVKVKKVKEMAAPRDDKGKIKPVPVKTKLTKQETGRVAEAGIRAYLRDIEGISDTVALNAGKTNESIDLFGDSMAPEVKGGLCSNSVKAQQWRITFSMELGKQEQAEYDALTPEQQKAWREKRQRACLDRKVSLLEKLSKERGKKIKPVTYTGIVNPDTQLIDIYKTDGYHQRIDWNDPKAEHVGTVRYEHAS